MIILSQIKLFHIKAIFNITDSTLFNSILIFFYNFQLKLFCIRNETECRLKGWQMTDKITKTLTRWNYRSSIFIIQQYLL